MGTERTDHAAKALRNLDGLHDYQAEEGMTDESMLTVAIEAHVQATLALVEEQRTANLIAYVQLLEMQYAEAAKHSDEFDHDTRADSVKRHGIALDRIREGLGL